MGMGLKVQKQEATDKQIKIRRIHFQLSERLVAGRKSPKVSKKKAGSSSFYAFVLNLCSFLEEDML